MSFVCFSHIQPRQNISYFSLPSHSQIHWDLNTWSIRYWNGEKQSIGEYLVVEQRSDTRRGASSTELFLSHLSETLSLSDHSRWLCKTCYHKGLELGIFHRDSSIHLRLTPTPNFYATKSFSKVGRCALRRAPNFMKLTPEFKSPLYLVFWRCGQKQRNQSVIS